MEQGRFRLFRRDLDHTFILAEQYQIKLMLRAVRDVENIYRYIAQTLSEPGMALDLLEELGREIASLKQFPNRCAPRKEGAYAGRGYRQLFIKNGTVISRVDEAKATVSIVTVRHSSS